MYEPILLLRLEGPLQSWGVRSRWSLRDSGREPNKSAIIGILGCAAGICRADWRSGAEINRTLEHWNDSLLFGVRIDRPGTLETDYHTVQGRFWQANGNMKTAFSTGGAKPDKANREQPHTEITWRDYLHDAAFLVALALRPEYRARNSHLLENLKRCLQNPKWPLYLGRKACVPSRPILDRLANQYQDIEGAFQREPWAVRPSFKWLGDPQTAPEVPNLVAWIECPDGDHERQDSVGLNQLRFYNFRRCKRIKDIDTWSLPWRIA